MSSKLITVVLISLVGVLIMGALYWYFNYPVVVTTPALQKGEEKIIEETIGKIKEAGEIGNESIKSIKLEKPPFLK